MKNKKIITKIVLFIFFVFLFSCFSAAYTVPKGVDGYIYNLEEEIVDEVHISVTNINNSFFVEGISNGYYSIALDGEDGDLIEIKVWNDYHDNNLSLVLDGVMHGINLSLDTSLPPQEEPRRRGRRARLRTPRVITGIITLDEEPADPGIVYEIINLRTNESVVGEIRDEFNAFADVLEGEEGDELEIIIGNDFYNERFTGLITGDVVRSDLDLDITNQELRRRATFDKLKSFALYIGVQLVIVLGLLLIIRRRSIKKKT